MVGLALAGCGVLTKPGYDGGSGAGGGSGGGISAGGGSGGGTAGGSADAGSWLEVPLAIPTTVQGRVQKLVLGGGGRVWALVASQWVLRSNGAGGSFALVQEVSLPYFEDLAVTPGGQVAILSVTLRACHANCDQVASYDEVAVSGGRFGLCAGGERLYFAGADSDGGAEIYTFAATGWEAVGTMPIKPYGGCQALSDGGVVLAGTGQTGRLINGAATMQLPTLAGTSRRPDMEQWTHLAASGDVIFLCSEQGAVARPDPVNDGWRGEPVFSDTCLALAVRSAQEATAFAASATMRFDGAGWQPFGPSPPLVDIVTAVYGSDGSLYVGGVGADGKPHVFRR
jgi:hypothetical protein